MYIHLGQETVIRTADVVGIFDLDNSTVSKHTRDFLARAEKEKRVINVTYELPKSFVVVDDGTGLRVYISQISSTTLLKRTGFISDIANV